MTNNDNAHDTLFLVIKEGDGVVAEYQRQLYEASLLGIDRVMYCLVCDSNENNEHNRIDDSLEKLEMTCDILKMQLLDKTVIVEGPFYDYSKVVKTNEDGFLMSIIDSGADFTCYKNENKSKLQNRERVGKILVKSMAQK